MSWKKASVFITGVLMIVAGCYMLYLFSITENDNNDAVGTRALYAISGVLAYVLGTILLAPLLIRFFTEKLFDSLSLGGRMKEPPTHIYESAREAINNGKYGNAKKLLFRLIERYPHAVRPYLELIDILNPSDAQLSLKQAKRYLKKEEYDIIVDKAWKKTNADGKYEEVKLTGPDAMKASDKSLDTVDRLKEEN